MTRAIVDKADKMLRRRGTSPALCREKGRNKERTNQCWRSAKSFLTTLSCRQAPVVVAQATSPLCRGASFGPNALDLEDDRSSKSRAKEKFSQVLARRSSSKKLSASSLRICVATSWTRLLFPPRVRVFEMVGLIKMQRSLREEWIDAIEQESRPRLWAVL